MERLDVGVVGAGFAGLCAATLLGRAGHRVTLYERAVEPGPVGAAIVLQPSGLAVLAAMGLEEAVVARGAKLGGLKVRSRSGRLLLDLDYGIDPRWFGLGVSRGAIFDALFSAAREVVTVRAGVEVVGLRCEGGEGAEQVLVGAESMGELGRHRLVVVADGARSKLADVVPGRKVVGYPWGALWFVGAWDGETRLLEQVGDGARRFAGVLPMGERRASLFWSLRQSRLDAWREGFASWREEVVALAPLTRPLVKQIVSIDQVFFAPYFDVRMKRWSKPGVVVIGDAAHATSPQLGQGTNLALMDAWVLAKAVAEGGVGGLVHYERMRRRQLAYYQRATRWLTPLFQSDSRVLGWMRDFGFPLMRRVPPLKRLMMASMAGVASGFFGRREALVQDWPTRTA